MDDSELQRRYQAQQSREGGEALGLMALAAVVAFVVFVAHGLYTGDWIGWLDSIVTIKKAAQ